jgi:hypothetical protein
MERNTIKKIWLNTGHNHGNQTLFKPYTNNMVTSHMVPDISNIPDAFESPSRYQGNLFPPSR